MFQAWRGKLAWPAGGSFKGFFTPGCKYASTEQRRRNLSISRRTHEIFARLYSAQRTRYLTCRDAIITSHRRLPRIASISLRSGTISAPLCSFPSQRAIDASLYKRVFVYPGDIEITATLSHDFPRLSLSVLVTLPDTSIFQVLNTTTIMPRYS